MNAFVKPDIPNLASGRTQAVPFPTQSTLSYYLYLNVVRGWGWSPPAHMVYCATRLCQQRDIQRPATHVRWPVAGWNKSTGLQRHQPDRTYVKQHWRLCYLQLYRSIPHLQCSYSCILTWLSGDAVSVRGPLTTLSTPMTVVIDGNIKPVPPPVTAPDGCGILFTDANLGNSQSEHTLTMVFAAASGSIQYSISGLTYVFPLLTRT